MPKYTPEDGYLGSTDSDEGESTTSGDLNNPETMPLSSQREVDRHTWPCGSSSSKNDEQIEQRLKENEPERPKHKRSVEREIPESLRKLAPERAGLKPQYSDQSDDSEYNDPESILAMVSQREIDRHSWPDRGVSSNNNTQTEKRLKEMEPERPEDKNSDLKGAPESVQELAAERDDLKPRPPDQDDGRTHDESDSGPLPDESYPENWATLRRQAYKRDDYQCRNCGSKGGNRGNTELHAHHVVPRSRGGNDTLSNLVTLCSTCHRQIHEHLH